MLITQMNLSRTVALTATNPGKAGDCRGGSPDGLANFFVSALRFSRSPYSTVRLGEVLDTSSNLAKCEGPYHG